MKKIMILALALMLLLTGGCLAQADNNGGAKKVANRIAVFETNLGTFEIELFEDKAPKTTKNFIDLTEKGFYELADKSRFDGKKQFPEQEGNGYAWNNGEKTIGLGPLTDEDIQFIYDCIINAEVPPKTFDVYDSKYYNIIDEERNALYAGEQTPEQTAKYLQDRIGTFLSENY